MNLYEKYIKREIRYSKMFKKNSTLNIITIKSNTIEFVTKIINDINYKFKMNFKINLEIYDNIEQINLTKNNILILPIEGVALSFILYNYKKDDRYKYFIKKKNENFYNIGYGLSEFYISKIYNKEPYYFTENKDMLKFIYDIISLKEKYVFGLKNMTEYLSKYYL